MRIARAGGRYLESRERALWAALAGLSGLGGGAIALVALTLGSNPPAITAGITVVLSVGVLVGAPIARRLTSVRKGRLGERLVTNLLRQLPDDYWLVNDVPFCAGGNVDHVLIGPCGVVVIETKRLAGYIRCSGDEWSVNGYRRPSISRQVNAGACRVRYLLAERHPELASSALRWVESVIVFTHPLCRLEVNRPRTTIVRYSELLQVIREWTNKHRMAPETAATLAASLADSQRAALPR